MYYGIPLLYSNVEWQYIAQTFKHAILNFHFSDLKECRRRLLELLPDPGYSPDAVESVFNMYLSLLHGLLMVPGENTPSKMRYNVLFRWTHSLLGNTPQ